MILCISESINFSTIFPKRKGGRLGGCFLKLQDWATASGRKDLPPPLSMGKAKCSFLKKYLPCWTQSPVPSLAAFPRQMRQQSNPQMAILIAQSTCPFPQDPLCSMLRLIQKAFQRKTPIISASTGQAVFIWLDRHQRPHISASKNEVTCTWTTERNIIFRKWYTILVCNRYA